MERASCSLSFPPRLANNFSFNHISSSLTIIITTPHSPASLSSFSLYGTSLFPSSQHAHTAFIIIITTPTPNLFTLSTPLLSTSLPPSVTQWHPNSQVLLSCFSTPFFFFFFHFLPSVGANGRTRKCASILSAPLNHLDGCPHGLHKVSLSFIISAASSELVSY